MLPLLSLLNGRDPCMCKVVVVVNYTYMDICVCNKDILYYTILYYAILCHAILYYTIIYYAMLCHAMLYYTILCYAMLCYAILLLMISTDQHPIDLYLIKISQCIEALKTLQPSQVGRGSVYTYSYV